MSTITAATLADLTTVLVKARLARDWTQRQLAHALGMAELISHDQALSAWFVEH